MSNKKEVFRPAFDEPPAAVVYSNTDPKTLVSPSISYRLPYTEACSKHVRSTFGCSRVYIICSGTLSRETDKLELLVEKLKKDGVEVVGVMKGVRPHTPWSQIMKITNEAREAKADCLVTLGAGSITDCAKIVVLVRYPADMRAFVSLTRHSGSCKRPYKTISAYSIFHRGKRTGTRCQAPEDTTHLHRYVPLWRRIFLACWRNRRYHHQA